MNFSYTINTAADTAKASAKTTTAKFIEGIIHEIQIFFPEGHKGLTHIQIFDGEIQIFPTNLGVDYSGSTIMFKTNYQITRPWELIIKTWNLDDTFAHDIIVRFSLNIDKLTSKQIIIKEREKNIFEKFFDLFRNQNG